MARVITYQLAYLSDHTVNLCRHHSECDDYGTLGPVQHGLHEGTCERCQHLERLDRTGKQR